LRQAANNLLHRVFALLDVLLVLSRQNYPFNSFNFQGLGNCIGFCMAKNFTSLITRLKNLKQFSLYLFNLSRNIKATASKIFIRESSLIHGLRFGYDFGQQNLDHSPNTSLTPHFSLTQICSKVFKVTFCSAISIQCRVKLSRINQKIN